jgi:hypothetical protein
MATLQPISTSQTSSPNHLASLTSEQQAELVASVSQLYTQWKQGRQVLEQRWKACWQAYLCDQETFYTESEPLSHQRSQIVRPVLYEAVEAIHAHLLNSLFPSGEKFFTVQSQGKESQEKTSLVEAFLQEKLQELGFSEQYALFLKQAIITGNSVAAVPWRQEHSKQAHYETVELLGMPVGQRLTWEDTLSYDGPSFDVIDLFDFLVDPEAKHFNEAMVIRRLERPVHELENNPHYQNIEALKTSLTQRRSEDANRSARRHSFGLQDEPIDNKVQPDVVELLEAWGDFQLNGEIYPNYVCVVSRTGTLLRFEPNPLVAKPFVFTTFIPVPNEIYGLGAIEKSLGLQHTINTLTNQKLDVINISINNPFTYLVTDDIFDPETMVTRPGALIPVKSHETLKPINYLNDYTVAFKEIADLKAEVQEATGALKYFTGSTDGLSFQNRTATEVSALVQGGAQKFSSVLNHLEQSSLLPFLNLTLSQAKRYLKQPTALQIQQQNGHSCTETMTPSLLRSIRCNLRISGSQSLINRRQEVDALIAFIRLAQESPELKEQVDLIQLYKRIYRHLGFKDEDRIFKTKQLSSPAFEAPEA